MEAEEKEVLTVYVAERQFYFANKAMVTLTFKVGKDKTLMEGYCAELHRGFEELMESPISRPGKVRGSWVPTSMKVRDVLGQLGIKGFQQVVHAAEIRESNIVLPGGSRIIMPGR